MTKPQRPGHSGRDTDNNQRYRNEIKRQAEAGNPLPALTVLHHDIHWALWWGVGLGLGSIDEPCPFKELLDAPAQ